jgi:hypothetical protein
MGGHETPDSYLSSQNKKSRTMILQTNIFWAVMPSSLVERYNILEEPAASIFWAEE